MWQEHLEKSGGEDRGAEAERLSKEVLPIERIELRYGMDMFATRRKWLDEVLDNPGGFLRRMASAPFPPGVCMAIMGMCAPEEAESPAAEAQGRQFFAAAADAARAVPSGMSYKEIGGTVAGRYTVTAEKAMTSLLALNTATIPVRVQAFRERQRLLHSLLEHAPEEERWKEAA